MVPLRKAGLALALLATIGASVVEFETPESVAPQPAGSALVQSARAPTPASAPADAVKPVALADGLSRAPFVPQTADLFAVHSWQPPPARAPKADPPPPPAAPALPFRYLGKVLDQGQVIAFVAQDSRTHLLRSGDLVADYRVIEITPSDMSFMYLPLNQRQRLTFGSAH